MKAAELRDHLNNTFGSTVEWPKQFEVDNETYANCCQAIFNTLAMSDNVVHIGDVMLIELSIGPHKGLMFKSVELILEPRAAH